MYSGIAEGADRLIAEQVLRTPDGRVVGVLPRKRSDCEQEFGAEGSPSQVHFRALLAECEEVIELPDSGSVVAGYVAVGNTILERCDVLLAVWDGRDPVGPGGTGAVVAQARAMKKPVIIVKAGNLDPVSKRPTTMGDVQGQVSVEGIPQLR